MSAKAFTNVILKWAYDVFFTIISLTFLEVLIPDSSMRKYIRFIFSLIVMAVILEPLINLLERFRML